MVSGKADVWEEPGRGGWDEPVGEEEAADRHIEEEVVSGSDDGDGHEDQQAHAQDRNHEVGAGPD